MALPGGSGHFEINELWAQYCKKHAIVLDIETELQRLLPSGSHMHLNTV